MSPELKEYISWGKDFWDKFFADHALHPHPVLNRERAAYWILNNASLPKNPFQWDNDY